LVQHPAKQFPVISAQPHPPRNGNVVDEDFADLQYFSPFLKVRGDKVRATTSCDEGLSLLPAESFDLVVGDQGTNAFEGHSVVGRKNHIEPHVPVVAVARCLNMRCYLEAMQLGAVDYLAGPITVQELGRAVETHLRLRAA
jgi:DNA-binding NtrC family response regulator